MARRLGTDRSVPDRPTRGGPLSENWTLYQLSVSARCAQGGFFHGRGNGGPKGRGPSLGEADHNLRRGGLLFGRSWGRMKAVVRM
ncbi:hypothetical protein [Pasteuria penetrans]|uniref:hypothetical protein n=1 Tax=Pasteuria penetrans TaxID=86005 RepID=UPI0011F01B86|nr:hypothetical protein [Pasteuria penetrans]